MQILPLFDRVLVKPTKPKTTTKSGLSLTTKDEGLYKSGIICATGEGIMEDYKQIKLQVNVGDHIIFDEYTTTKINYEDSEYYLIKQTDILAIIKE